MRGDFVKRAGSESGTWCRHRGVRYQTLTAFDDDAVGQGHVDEVIGTDEGDAKGDERDGRRNPAGTSPDVGKCQAAANTREQQHRQSSEQLHDSDEDGSEQSDGGQEEQAGEDGECVHQGNTEVLR